MEVCLLGCGGSMPVPNRFLTSLIVSYNGRKILIDCGEGTQVSMKILGTGFKRIDAICFTHFHADHVAGLPGILLTIGNSGRTDPLNIIGPIGLKKVIEGLLVIAPVLPFELKLIEITETNLDIVVSDMIIKTLSVKHTIACLAYSIEIKRQRRFDPDKAKENNVPMILWKTLQKEDKVVSENVEYTKEMVLSEERKGIKICYCTDTRPFSSLETFAENSELFICEGMYGDEKDLDKAIENRHMLFTEAATLGKNGNVKELWLTHFSPSLSQPEQFLQYAKNIFYNTKLGEDRKIKTLKFSG